MRGGGAALPDVPKLRFLRPFAAPAPQKQHRGGAPPSFLGGGGKGNHLFFKEIAFFLRKSSFF